MNGQDPTNPHQESAMPYSMPDSIDALFDLLAVHGGEDYHGEAVTQLQHALQCALRAEQAGAAPPLVAAALFHDAGHLIHDLGEDAAERGIDDVHEARGAALLQTLFGPSVTEPVRLHVEAKRCLCAIDAGYYEALSPASRTSLALQGGVMSAEAAEMFLAMPFAGDAVRLRRWDDQAKDPVATTPPLDHYRDILSRHALGRATAAPSRG